MIEYSIPTIDYNGIILSDRLLDRVVRRAVVTADRGDIIIREILVLAYTLANIDIRRTSQFLKRLAFRLRDEQCSENPDKPKCQIDLIGTYMKRAKISMTWFNQALVPPLFLKGPINACEMIAPTLPAAALIPCAVERYLVGKT